MVAGRDHVGAGCLELSRDLCGQTETARRVLAVDDREVGPELFLEPGEERLDRFTTRVSDDVRDKKNSKEVVRHMDSLLACWVPSPKGRGATKKGVPSWDSLSELFGVFDGPGLAHHGDADLAGETELAFDALRDVPRHELSSGVVDLLRLDQDPNLAAGLDGVGLLDTLERIGDLLQLFEPLDVSVQRLPARPRAGSGDGVGRDQQQRLDGVRFLVVVMRTHRVYDRGGHPMSLQ